MATKYEHLGVAIEFQESTAKFFAVINGRREASSSLSGIKQKISAVKKAGFKEFDCISNYNDYPGNKKPTINTGKVVGLEPSRSRFYKGRLQFAVLLNNGQRTEAFRVWKDTEKNRALIAEVHAEKRRFDALKTAHEKAVMALESKMDVIYAQDFVAKDG